MRKRFVILLENPTKEQHDAFLNYVRGSGQFGWWHWLNGSWLLYTTVQAHTAETVRQTVGTYYGNTRHLVLELRPDGNDAWYGFGPNGKSPGENDMFQWIHENWHR